MIACLPKAVADVCFLTFDTPSSHTHAHTHTPLIALLALAAVPKVNTPLITG